MRLNVELSEPLYTSLKSVTASEGRSIAEAVREMVTAWLKERGIAVIEHKGCELTIDIEAYIADQERKRNTAAEEQ